MGQSILTLDRPFEPGAVFVPNDARLVDGKLLWTMRSPTRFHPPRPSVLEHFRKLHEQPDAAILTFVKKFGIAWFCQHNLPGAHAQYPFSAQFVKEECFPIAASEEYQPRAGAKVWFQEDLKVYRRYSEAADAIVAAAGHVNAGEMPPRDLFIKFMFARRELHLDLLAFPHLALKNPQRVRPRYWMDSARNHIAEEVNIWVAITQAKPTLRWHSGSWRMTVAHSPWGVLGAVALALLTSVPSSQGWYLCAVCSDWYQPTRPIPAERNRFCDDCRGTPEYEAFRKRQQRAKKVKQ